MKAIVTGGAGFIASHVVDAYIKEGFKVAVIDNLSTGFRRNLNPQAEFYQVDIRDRDEINRIFEIEKPQIVNHHAAQMDVRRSVEDPVYDAECNILGSLNLIMAAKSAGTEKFIYISTGGAVHGEPQHLPVKEDHPINPECPYGITKHTVEHYLYLFNFLYGLKYTILRYPNIYGPRQNPKGEAGVNAIFIDAMLEGRIPMIFGDGEQLRDYVFIEDVVRANQISITKGDGEIINLGTGKGISVNTIYRELQEIIGFDNKAFYASERPGEINRIYLDAGKAKEILGWEAEVSFREGLKRTVEWRRNYYKA
ncbi:MAG: NAD-dependent epimerase/dehydratase family protein [FCB group bacterium]|nr:NAD-dependent epimerase/dehydratase family protein [FCB group bacterium]